MNTSVIRHRVADFLARHAPFDTLPHPELLELAASGRVKFHESEEFVLQEGAPYGNLVWIVQQGQVELIGSNERLLDVKGEGDVLGLERFAGDDATALYSARTTTDVILYGVSASHFASLIPRHEAVRRFVDAHISVAGLRGFARHSWLDAPPPPIELVRALAPSSSALPPTQLDQSSYSTRNVMRAMIESGDEKVSLTGVEPAGIVTAADLSLFCGANPPLLLRYLRQAASQAERTILRDRLFEVTTDALAQPSDVDDCLAINLAASLAAASSAAREAEHGLPPGVARAWLVFGSAARGEIRADEPVALAFIYDDSTPDVPMPSFAHAGDEACWPRGFRSVMPLSECLDFFREMIRKPLESDLYGCSMLLDCRLAHGDESILNRIQNCVQAELAEHRLAILLLANDTLAHLPPLTFFQGIVLDWDGARRESFNILDTVISPIAGAARVFALAGMQVDCVNTLDRLRIAEASHPGSTAVLREAAEAFRAAMYFQTLSGSSSQHIESQKLSKLEQRLLKTAFVSIEHLLEFTVETYVSTPAV